MAEIITLNQQVHRKQVKEDVKISFPDKFIKTSIFGNIIIHEDSRIFASINVQGNQIKVRTGQRLGDFLILLIGGSLGSTPSTVGSFAEIRQSKSEALQKYSNWIKEKYYR